MMILNRFTSSFIILCFHYPLRATAQDGYPCKYRGGEVAPGNVICPGTNFCCTNEDTCMDNGLCRDKNNHPNGSLTLLQGAAAPGPYNYTGLYFTPSCVNPELPDCLTECSSCMYIPTLPTSKLQNKVSNAMKQPVTPDSMYGLATMHSLVIAVTTMRPI